MERSNPIIKDVDEDSADSWCVEESLRVQIIQIGICLSSFTTFALYIQKYPHERCNCVNGTVSLGAK